MSGDSEHGETLARGRPKRGLRDGSDRTATIARWLDVLITSERVTELVLEIGTADKDPDVMARWDRTEVTPELAPAINALIADSANDLGTTVSALLYWGCADGTKWRSKAFRAMCDDTLREHARPLDGSSLSIITQLQRSVEAKDRMMIEMFRASGDRHKAELEILDRMLARLEQRATNAETEAAELEETAELATAEAERAARVAEQAIAKAEEKAGDDKVANVINIVARQLMAPPPQEPVAAEG
jgi:hypothetical protein